ncbi:MAG: M16 family metallopeptidase [Gemmatimonadaceae bacterium]
MGSDAAARGADPRHFSLDHASVRRHVLRNGLTVLVRRDPSAPVAAVVTYVKAGYFDETDDVVGIAHVLEHMYFKGTPTRGVGEIAKQTKASGGYLNAHTIYDHTMYYTVLPSAGFVSGLEIQADAYASSLIDAEELRKELEVIIQEAKRKADNPSAVATETLYEVLHDRHRMRRWRIGREAGLRQLTREHLLGFYRNFYRPSETILAIVGDLDPDEVMRHVERLYAALPDGDVARTPGPPEPERRGFRCRELSGDVAQSQLVMGWRTPGSLHADTPLLDLLATVLGTGRASRLYRAVRERQLAASVTAYNYTPTELGVFVVHAETPPDTALGAARGVWEQVREVRESGVGAHEIERARRIFESRWVRRLETMEGQAQYLAEWEALGGWQQGDRYLERVLCAPVEQVTEVARRYLDPEHAAVVLYRPAKSPEVLGGAERLRSALDADRPAPLPTTPPRAARATPATRGAPRLEREEQGVRVYRSPTGLPILVRRRPGAPIAHLGVFALGGPREEGAERAGLSTFVARTAVKGTTRRSAAQIAEDAELLGGSVGSSVGGEHLGWTLSVPTQHVVAALDLLADVTQHATFPEAAAETERAVLLSDLAMLRDDMYRYPVRLALSSAFAGHPYGVPAMGTEESLARLSADDLRAWHRERVLRAPAVAVVVGDLDPDDVAGVVSRDFGRIEPGELGDLPAPAWPDAATQTAESREKAQTALALAFPGPGRRDPDRFAAEILAGVASGLGGRFFDELRDKQSLAYTVHAYTLERTRAGAFLAYIATGPQQEETARRGLLAEFEKLRAAPVTAEELARAKTYAIGTHAIRQQSGGAVLADIVDAWLLGAGLGELAAYESSIASVSAEAIQRLAQRYFDPERRVEGIVRGVGRTV